MIHKDVCFENIDNVLTTVGLVKWIGKEVACPIGNSNQKDAESVLRYIVDYVVGSSPKIEIGQTIGYHSWILKFEDYSEEAFLLHEADAKGTGYVRGIDNAVRGVNEQSDICRNFRALPMFPSFGQKIAISKGIYEGLPLQGVRYPSPEHMTGWWLTTDLYDGDIKSMMVVHYYHVVFARQDIVKYLALPYGFRFHYTSGRGDVWFDGKIE